MDCIRFSDYEANEQTRVNNDRMFRTFNGGLNDQNKALLEAIKANKEEQKKFKNRKDITVRK